MIVHDLRQPLQSLIGGLATVPLLGELTAEQREFLEMSVDGGETLLGMINDVLDISRMEGGGLTLDPASVEPPALARAAVRQVRHLAEEKRLNLALDLHPEHRNRADLVALALSRALECRRHAGGAAP